MILGKLTPGCFAKVVGTLKRTCHFVRIFQNMAPPDTFRCRLRFRVQKKLNISAREHVFRVRGRDIVLAPPLSDQNIADSEWLVFNARGFATEPEATEFGHKLRAALEVSSVATRFGVDAGQDRATSGLGALYREQIAEQTGTLIRNNIHGVDVFVDSPNVRILHSSITGVVLAGPEPLLSDLDGLHDIAVNASPRSKDVILLLNAALMQPHPVAQIVFAFSAVEMLGQLQTDWTDDQKRLLEKLANDAETSSTVNAAEGNEIALAIRRSHRLSLRQGVLRLLDDLDLAALKPAWDKAYEERSTLIHGLAPQPGVDYSDLARRVVSLCGRILLKAIAAEIPEANRHVDKFYEPA
jgi:hypothetical protein